MRPESMQGTGTTVAPIPISVSVTAQNYNPAVPNRRDVRVRANAAREGRRGSGRVRRRDGAQRCLTCSILRSRSSPRPR